MGKFSKFSTIVAAPILALGLATWSPAQATPAADVIFVVDESGSMSGEHSWLGSMISSMETDLLAAGIGGGVDKNRYGLVGFGSSSHAASQDPHQHDVGGAGSQFGTAAEFGTATSGLVASGSVEDGWEAIMFALSYSTIRTASDVALNIVLVTDEDRDNTSSDTFSSTLAALNTAGGILNTVINAPITKSGNPNAIGLDDEGNALVADGGGSYTVEAGYSVVANTSKTDYADMAHATGGATWDLNILRLGGLNATSFTDAFVDVKVTEIEEQILPEPGMMIIFGAGVLGLAYTRRRKVA